ncbi:MAG: hypothetical protein PHU06_13350 [Gallionella sp.]|nr:hypothetical protein [Gallionella sp.]MDD4959796.1 hypothetical protein [Gallionella sp.]
MKLLTHRTTLIALALVSLMAVTRFYHFGTTLHLPDASLAIFVLAGFFIRSPRFLAALLLLAGGIDYLAITQFGVSDYCVTPAYGFLAPIYALLWATGRYASQAHARNGVMLATLAFASVSVAFVLSNATFFAFSGRYADLGAVGYAQEVAQYYVPYLTSAAIYLLPAALLAVVLRTRLSVIAR